MSGSPRPTFDAPTHIKYEDATRHVWGDQTSGEVIDWIYVSSHKIHQLVFGLATGGVFRHSDEHRTVFAADELYYVLSGTFVFCNPETGEVHPAKSGEAIFFRRDTWHHGFNYGTEPLRVLEFFAPPPSQGSSGAYSKTKPGLATSKYTQDEWLGHWPMSQGEIRDRHTMKHVRESDLCWRLEGRDKQVLVGLLVSTDQLTVGKVVLLPGQQTEVQIHGGDECLYLLEGSLTLRVLRPDSAPWYELKPADGFYLPEGTPHQYLNLSDKPMTLLFGVAPRYLPAEK
jgi:quercetin dioxygenase-like cupin family protein